METGGAKMEEMIRIVVCQLECHPAFYIDRMAYLEEPFIPDKDDISLSNLGGLGVPDLIDLKLNSKNSYIEWNQRRLRQILKHPLLNEEVIRLIVFPEGSIPVENLPILHSFSQKTGSIIVAGSHSFQDTVESKNIYKKLGKLKQLSKSNRLLNQVCFILRSPKINVFRKQTLSPEERNDVTPLSTKSYKVYPTLIKLENFQFKLLPLVCADALQHPKTVGDYDISTIISYTPKTEYFDSYIETEVNRGKLVIYVNDGKFGGSFIGLPLDMRGKSFIYDPHSKGKLPQGDFLQIVDVPVKERATQVGVVNPKIQYEVKLFSPINYLRTKDESTFVSDELKKIASIEDNNARYAKLIALKKKVKSKSVHRPRINYLEDLARKGMDNETIWKVFGQDVLIDLHSIRDLESSLTEKCMRVLLPLLMEDDLDENALLVIKRLLKEYRKINLLKDKFESKKSEKHKLHDKTIINREIESNEILKLFDSKSDFILQCIGLKSIGKSSIINKAIDNSIFKHINIIELTHTSSKEYIYNKLLANPWTDSFIKDIEIDEHFSDDNLGQYLSDWDLIWFQNCESLVVGKGWRSKDYDDIFHKIIDLARERETNLVFESAIELPFDLKDPSTVSKVRIRGLDWKKIEHGVTLLDKHLRNLGLSPNDIINDDKRKLVKMLGGHPLAIIYSVNAIYNEGLTNVFRAIRKGGGFYKRIIDIVMRLITLSEEDEIILRLLAGSKVDVPRDLISSVCNFNVTDKINNLIRLCLVEVASPITIRIPGLLKNIFRFRELENRLRRRFHGEAARLYSILAERDTTKTEYAIAAELHSRHSGKRIKISTGMVDSHISHAYELYEDKQYIESKKVIDKLLEGRHSIDVLRLSCLVDIKLGRYDDALAKAKKVFSYNPTDDFLFRDLTDSALRQSRDDIAEKLVIIAQGSSIDETSILITKGKISRRRGDLHKAKWHYNEAVKTTKNNPWPFFYLGKALFDLGKFSDAIYTLESGLNYFKNRPGLTKNAKDAIETRLGIAYIFNDQIDRATPIIEELIEKSPEHPEIVQAYAVLTVKRDGIENAAGAYEKFSKIKPRTWKQKGQYNLYFGTFLLAIGKVAEANDCFANAHKFEPNNVYVT